MSQMLADLRNTNLESAERVRAQREAASIKDAEAQARAHAPRGRRGGLRGPARARADPCRTEMPADALAEARAGLRGARARDDQDARSSTGGKTGRATGRRFSRDLRRGARAHHDGGVLAKLEETPRGRATPEDVASRARPPLRPRTRCYRVEDEVNGARCPRWRLGGSDLTHFCYGIVREGSRG